MPLLNLQNSRVYWLAFVVDCGAVLFGYDTGIGGGVVAQDLFQRTYGMKNAKGIVDIARRDSISSNIVSVLMAGAFFGALGSAPISSRFGRKNTLLGFVIAFSIGAALQTALGGGRGLGYIYSGRVIAGIGVGGISAVSPAFVSECSPKEVRGRITGLFQFMVTIGVMLSYWVNLGASLHLSHSEMVWRVPLGLQLVPAGIMALGLLTVKESPRWLASQGRVQEARENLAYMRKELPTSDTVLGEFAEIEAQIKEEREARAGLGLKEALFGKGNFIRFLIAFVIFLLQQWSGQNSVGYYAPRIFQSIGYHGTSSSLLASGIYGIFKVIATFCSVFFLCETLGRKRSLFISAMGMGILFYIVGALLKMFPPNANAVHPPLASKAMAAMIYIYVCFYSMGWGPIPWIYCSEIFPTRTRHFGLSTASATQWLFNFTVSYTTPHMITNLGWKIFIMYATVNVGAMATFSLLIPETKGRSLEEMNALFGTVGAGTSKNDIERPGIVLVHELRDSSWISPDDIKS